MEIILLITIHYFLFLVLKPSRPQLNCGLFGYSGTRPDKYKIAILGLMNDYRGGDASGLFVVKNNGRKLLTKSVEMINPLFKDSIDKFMESIDENDTVIMGHTRKASVGGKSMSGAQPVLINSLENDINIARFVMTHNGTITNYMKLLTNYNLPNVYGESDSQSMARIFSTYGYSVLTEYVGAGAFVFWNRQAGEDSIMIYKGESKTFSDSDETYEERPLFMMKTNGGIYYSSTEESLNVIKGDGDVVSRIPTNKFITINKGVIVSEYEVSRKNCYNTEFPRQKYAAKAIGYYGAGQQAFDFDEYYERTYHPQVNHTIVAVGKTTDKEKKEHKSTNKKYNKESKKHNSPIHKSPLGNLLGVYKDCEIYFPENIKNSTGRVAFGPDGTYWLEGQPLDGEYSLTNAGFLSEGYSSKEYYFIKGVMMKNKCCYIAADKFIAENFDDEDDCLPAYLCHFSTTPVGYQNESGELTFFFGGKGENSDFECFNGKFAPYFDIVTRMYDVEEGEIKEMITYSATPAYQMTNEEARDDREISNLTWEVAVNHKNVLKYL